MTPKKPTRPPSRKVVVKVYCETNDPREVIRMVHSDFWDCDIVDTLAPITRGTSVNCAVNDRLYRITIERIDRKANSA